MAGAQESLFERRNFLQIAAGSAAALVTGVPRVEAQETESQAGGDDPYTRGMADFVAGLRYDQIPTAVRHPGLWLPNLVPWSNGCTLDVQPKAAYTADC